MKATGIIRRIDDLGRIVIPKEIRKNLRLKNGENLEIFIDENENIILRKYNQIDKLKDLAQNITSSFYNITKNNIFITNTNNFISVSTKYKEYMDKELSKEIIKMINARKDVKADGEIWLTDEKKEMGYFAFCPIISNGDVIGSSIILSDKTVSDEDFNLLKIISTFLAKYIEE